MKCGGLHCPGCGNAGSIPVIAALLIAAEVILNALWWLIAVTVIAAALAVAAVVLLSRATARREAEVGAMLEATRPARLAAATGKPQVARGPQMPALEQHVHYHVHYEGSREPARVIPLSPEGPGELIAEKGTDHGTSRTDPRTAR